MNAIELFYLPVIYNNYSGHYFLEEKFSAFNPVLRHVDSSIGDGGSGAFLRIAPEPSHPYTTVSVEWSEKWIKPLGALNLQALNEPVDWCLLILHKRTSSFVQ